jgi:hypothetical protein
MKKRDLLLFASIVVAISMNGCSDDNNILAALDGKKKLSEGDPVQFILYQNYPNPFNPSTLIRFALYDNMHIRLAVYTEDWTEVEVIIDGQFQGYEIIDGQIYAPFQYTASYHAHNLASGVYFYVLEGGGHKQIRKMHLVK